MRVLVTGADGFVGSHLLKELINRDHEVVAGALYGSISMSSCERIELNVLDLQQLKGVLEKIRPEGIIHLAAQSMVKIAWEHPADTCRVNTIGTISLIETAKKIVPDIKIISVGSSEEYGLSGKSGKPLEEEEICLPQNPYASSKLAAGQIALQLAHKDKLKIIHVRPFNHFGPGQPAGFVVSDFASQIARIEQGLEDYVVRVGDLTAQRDFTDVRDVVKAYALLLENDVENGVYNICSGVPRSAKEILEFLVKMAQTSIHLQVDETRLRASEVPLFLGSAAKITKAVGWRPERNFMNSLLETLNWWRQSV